MNKFSIKLVDKYIFSQVLFASLAGIILFIVIWISPEILFRIIRQTVAGEITANSAVKLFFLEIPEILGKAIPVGLLLGSLFVFDRLSKNFELTILRSIGISFKRLFMPILILGLLGSVFCFYTYEKAIPYSTNQIKIIRKDISNSQFVYIDKDKEGRPKQAIIVASYNGKNIQGLNVLQFAPNVSDNTPLMENIISAQNADYSAGKWIINKGSIYNVSKTGIYDEIRKFDKMTILEGNSADKAYQLMNYATKEHQQLKMKDINQYLTILKAEKLDEEYRYMQNKLYQRYSQAFSCILLALSGVILGWSKPRQNRIIGFTAGALLIFGYYLVVPFLDLLAEKGVMPPLLTAWLPCILIAIGISAYYKHQEL